MAICVTYDKVWDQGYICRQWGIKVLTYDKVSDQGSFWRQWDSENRPFFKCIFWANEVLGTLIYNRMVGFCWSFYKNSQNNADLMYRSPTGARYLGVNLADLACIKMLIAWKQIVCWASNLHSSQFIMTSWLYQILATWPKALSPSIVSFSTPIAKAEYAKIHSL